MSHFVTTEPAAYPCAKCGRLTLVGLDQGVPYRADAAPVAALTELRALQAGLRSFTSTGRYVRLQLTRRTAAGIRRDPTRGRPAVYVEHMCAAPLTAMDIDLDPVSHEFHARLMRNAKPKPQQQPQPQELGTLFTIHESLGGRVIEINDDTPPF